MFKKYSVAILSLILFISSAEAVFAGGPDDFQVVTDSNASAIISGFFDLRDRESFIQITNTDQRPEGLLLHVQIFNVADNCNENDFFDAYTPADTHTYNLRNILTNDGNPSGVVLPDNAYGIVIVGVINPDNGGFLFDTSFIGNLRIVDASGYEYRTNLQGIDPGFVESVPTLTFNYNAIGGTTLSDVVGIVLSFETTFDGEVQAADLINNFVVFDIDIYNLDEVPFSCRDVVFACVDEDNPRLEELLEFSGVSVASFEYGINDAVPHSRGGELLCPGNNINEGIVRINVESETGRFFRGFVGLNNGNGRGSIDSFWLEDESVNPMPGG